MGYGNSVPTRLGREQPRPTRREYAQAVADLHGLLLVAGRFEVARRRGAVVDCQQAEAIAQSAATNALRDVLSRLHEYRGQTKFSTWACKFALVEAAKDIRCRVWRDREVSFEAASWNLPENGSQPPGRESGERLAALRDAIEHDLSRRQRQALVATAINAVPIDVVAERWGSSRGAVYESIHDARRALRTALAERGLGVDQNTGSESS
jgi:RNA polymerase sigma-70 factor, ECF subfamily